MKSRLRNKLPENKLNSADRTIFIPAKAGIHQTLFSNTLEDPCQIILAQSIFPPNSPDNIS